MVNLEVDLATINMTPQEFETLAFDCANDRHWCRFNKVDDINPNFSEVREKLYQELLFYSKEEERQSIQ